MSQKLLRYDLSLAWYFSYPPAPGVANKPMIPRKEEEGLYIRGEYGAKPMGPPRPLSAHNSTHLDTPLHFFAKGEDLEQLLNNKDHPADRPSLARVVYAKETSKNLVKRRGFTYCERVEAKDLPPIEDLQNYETLVVFTGFGDVMESFQGQPYEPAEDGWHHIPHMAQDAVDKILESGLRLLAIDSTTIEPQTSLHPFRMDNQAHLKLLGNKPPVLIVEGLSENQMEKTLGFQPKEGMFQLVPRRANAKGAEAAHARAWLYLYQEDPQGEALRKLLTFHQPDEIYG